MPRRGAIGVKARRTATTSATFASGTFQDVLTVTLKPGEELHMKGFGGWVAPATAGTSAIVAHRLRLRFSLDTARDEIIGSPAGLSSEIYFPGRKSYKNTSNSDATVIIAAVHNETAAQHAFVWLDEG